MCPNFSGEKSFVFFNQKQQMRKGYEIEPGRFVIVESQELQQLKPKETRIIRFPRFSLFILDQNRKIFYIQSAGMRAYVGRKDQPFLDVNDYNF